MKKIVIITDGEDLRAFRLTTRRSNRGLRYDTEEVDVSFHGSHRHSPAMLEHAVFGESDLPAPVKKADGGDARRRTMLRGIDDPDEREVQCIAKWITRVIRREKPDLWNLMAPPDLSNELFEVLDSDVMERLTCVQIGDLLEITAEQVEEHFHPMGCRLS